MSHPQLQGADLGPYGGSELERAAELWYLASLRQAERLLPAHSTLESGWADAHFFVYALDALLRTAELAKAHLRDRGNLKAEIKRFKQRVPQIVQFRDSLVHFDERMARIGANPDPTAQESSYGPALGVLHGSEMEIIYFSGAAITHRTDVKGAVLSAHDLMKAVIAAHSLCDRCPPRGTRTTPERPYQAAQAPPGAIHFNVKDHPGTERLSTGDQFTDQSGRCYRVHAINLTSGRGDDVEVLIEARPFEASSVSPLGEAHRER